MKSVFSSMRRLFVSTWPSALVALIAWISIVVAIDPAGSYPDMPEGPGLTVDEIFNVEQGVLLVEQTRALGWLNLVPGTSVEAFKPENHYLPDHPPLGRYWLGVHHHLTWWLFPPFDPEGPCVTACARTGSATAFALTVWMIGLFATVHYGRAAGLFASLALVLMPRLYGHAHIASLETITNLTCTAAVLAVAHWWSGTTPPSRRVALLSGVVMGLALLTKIQAILIPIPVIAWALWRWRAKAIVPLLVWGVTANLVFFTLWPYLWLDPIGHFLEYLGRTTNRATINCFYFGVRYADKAVPWHYPFVMFAVTVPLGLHLLGVWGVWKREVRSQKSEGDAGDRRQETEGNDSGCKRSQDWLLLACTVFPLIVFALPGVAVYDGERLFLTVFPLWAIFVGRGLGRLWSFELAVVSVSVVRCLLVCGLVWLFTISIHLRPCQLCYYNELIGGLSGADRRGMEVDYWGVGITRGLLLAMMERNHGDSLAIGPTLHQFQAEEYRRQSPVLRGRGVKVIAAEAIADSRMKYILFRRRADLSSALAQNVPRVRFPSRWWGRDFVGPLIVTRAPGSIELLKQEDPSP